MRFVLILEQVYKDTYSLLKIKRCIAISLKVQMNCNSPPPPPPRISDRKTSNVNISLSFTRNSLKNLMKNVKRSHGKFAKIDYKFPEDFSRDTHSQTSKTTCCRRSGNFCTIVTGCPLVRLMPYIGAVVLYLVLQSLAGEPQLSFAENARPENPVMITS